MLIYIDKWPKWLRSMICFKLPGNVGNSRRLSVADYRINIEGGRYQSRRTGYLLLSIMSWIFFGAENAIR